MANRGVELCLCKKTFVVLVLPVSEGECSADLNVYLSTEMLFEIESAFQTSHRNVILPIQTFLSFCAIRPENAGLKEV